MKAQVHEAAATARAHRAPRPQAGEPLRRPTPACRDGPGDRAQGRRVPVRRAAVQPRREAARADAHRDPAHAAATGHDHRLRHPRPDRGDDPWRPGRRAAQGTVAAGGVAARALRAARQPVRRRVHRLPTDELHSRPTHRWPARDALRHPSGQERPDAACRRARPGDPRHPARGLRGLRHCCRTRSASGGRRSTPRST